jgi:hypothetical protein
MLRQIIWICFISYDIMLLAACMQSYLQEKVLHAQCNAIKLSLGQVKAIVCPYTHVSALPPVEEPCMEVEENPWFCTASSDSRSWPLCHF